MFKSVCVLSVLTFFGACSHHQPKKVSKPYHVSKSFFEIIKSIQAEKHNTEKRYPASVKSIPGLKEFVSALKANPEFLKVPVGYEVIKEIYEGEDYKRKDSFVYLKQNSHGHFVLEYFEGESVMFGLYESGRIEDVGEDILSQANIQSIKKVSPTKYAMILHSDPNETKKACQLVMDLTKSRELQEHTCKDSSGAIITASKVISVKAIALKNYASILKSIKLEVRPNALDCGKIQDGDEITCFDSIKDAEERDWSYLLK